MEKSNKVNKPLVKLTKQKEDTSEINYYNEPQIHQSTIRKNFMHINFTIYMKPTNSSKITRHNIGNKSKNKQMGPN